MNTLPADDRFAGQYRIYRLRAGTLTFLCDAPTPQMCGSALVQLYDDGEFDQQDDCVGIKRERGKDDKGKLLPGEWIVHPWALGRRASENGD